MMLYFKFDADCRNGAYSCKKSFMEKIIIWILKLFHPKKVAQEEFERLRKSESGTHIYLNNFKSVEEAVCVFKENAIAHGDCTESGDYKKGNVCYDTITDAIHFINAAHMSKVFEPLLSDANTSVRSWSAFALLHIDTKRAVKTLGEIAKQDNSLISFSAEMILSEFRKGNI